MKIFVTAKPNSREEKIEKSGDNEFVVSVKAPPVRGLANTAIIKVIADYFKIPVFKVKVVSGHTSRKKILEINL